MALASQVLRLVEASVIPLSASATLGAEAYMCMEGYSWKSNEYGLAIDSVTAFSLVTPNGTEMVVTEADKDLWFALKVCLSYRHGRRSNELTLHSYYREGSITT